MPDIILALHEAISKVCPIVGVTADAGKPKSEWRIDFSDKATDDEKKAAQAVIDAFDPTADTSEPRLVPKRWIIDRLHEAGKLEQALAVLNAQDAYTQQRWASRDAIYHNDPTTVAALKAIGADPDAIMAE